MNPDLVHRLVGLCVYSTITIAAFTIKMMWDSSTFTLLRGNHLTGFAFILIALAIAASIGSWRQRPWGYVLAILLTARENIDAIYSYYSQPVSFRYSDIISIGLAGIPLLFGMASAFVLLLTHYSRKADS